MWCLRTQVGPGCRGRGDRGDVAWGKPVTPAGMPMRAAGGACISSAHGRPAHCLPGRGGGRRGAAPCLPGGTGADACADMHGVPCPCCPFRHQTPQPALPMPPPPRRPPLPSRGPDRADLGIGIDGGSFMTIQNVTFTSTRPTNATYPWTGNKGIWLKVGGPVTRTRPPETRPATAPSRGGPVTHWNGMETPCGVVWRGAPGLAAGMTARSDGRRHRRRAPCTLQS